MINFNASFKKILYQAKELETVHNLICPPAFNSHPMGL